MGQGGGNPTFFFIGFIFGILFVKVCLKLCCCIFRLVWGGKERYNITHKCYGNAANWLMFYDPNFMECVACLKFKNGCPDEADNDAICCVRLVFGTARWLSG